MNNIIKKAIAEVIGTFVLVFVACGVAAITNGEITSTALAFGLVIVAMAYSIGRISGCHINPAVSLACLITKRMSLKDFLVYVCAQIVGGILGALAIFGFMKMAGCDFDAARDANTVKLIGDASNYVIGGDVNTGSIFASLFVEIILTCIFVYVILNVTAEKAKTSKIAGIIIGLTLTLVHLVGIGLTGTSVNPARSLATAITSAMFGNGTDALEQVWIFFVGPLLGGALAAVLYLFLHSDDKNADPMTEVESSEKEDAE